MGMTMTQKILAAHAGLDEVKAGQLIMANLDLVLGNDVTSPVAINEFNKAGFTDVAASIVAQPAPPPDWKTCITTSCASGAKITIYDKLYVSFKYEEKQYFF